MWPRVCGQVAPYNAQSRFAGQDSAAARAAPREGKGPQPESGKASAVARTTNRGAGSSLSCNHQVEVRRDFRLYCWCGRSREVHESGLPAASNTDGLHALGDADHLRHARALFGSGEVAANTRTNVARCSIYSGAPWASTKVYTPGPVGRPSARWRFARCSVDTRETNARRSDQVTTPKDPTRSNKRCSTRWRARRVPDERVYGE